MLEVARERCSGCGMHVVGVAVTHKIFLLWAMMCLSILWSNKLSGIELGVHEEASTPFPLRQSSSSRAGA